MTRGVGPIEIDVVDVFLSIWRGKLLIALFTLIFAAGGLAYAFVTPIQAVATRKVTIDYPFPVAAREACGFAASLTSFSCAAEYFTYELKTEIERLQPGQPVQVRNVSEGSAQKASQFEQFILSATVIYPAFDDNKRQAAESVLRASVSPDFAQALDVLRARYLNDTELYAKVLAETAFEETRSSETYTIQLTANRLAQQQLASGMPTVNESGPVLIEASHTGGNPIRAAIIWGLLGLVLATAFVVGRQVRRHWRASQEAL